jgi:hypothetical protein
MVAKGRPKYSPGPLKSIERLSSNEIDQIKRERRSCVSVAGGYNQQRRVEV